MVAHNEREILFLCVQELNPGISGECRVRVAISCRVKEIPRNLFDLVRPEHRAVWFAWTQPNGSSRVLGDPSCAV